MIVATLEIRGQRASENDELNMDNNSWKAKGPSDLRNEIGILSGSAAPLPFIFLIADCNSLIRNGAHLSSSVDGVLIRFLNCRLVSSLDCDMLSLLTLVVVVNEDVSFRFNISDGSNVVGHSFVRRVSIRSTVETLNNFPHVRTVGIGHRILEKIFPTFSFCLVDRLVSFTTSVCPLLATMMDRLMEAISVADFGSHMWTHSRFRSLTGFRFSNVSSSCRDEDVIEARNLKR